MPKSGIVPLTGSLSHLRRNNAAPSCVENVAGLILVKGGFVISFTSKNGEVGLPAGIIDPGDADEWHTLAREFEEESGQPMPDLFDTYWFIWRGHTLIIVGKTKDIVKVGSVDDGDGEVIEVSLQKISRMYAAAKGDADFHMRACAKKSFVAIVDFLKLMH